MNVSYLRAKIPKPVTFECATIYLGGESSSTLSSLPALFTGLMRSKQSAASDNTHVQAFQVAEQEISTGWDIEMAYEDAATNSVIAAALGI